jgi:hypothetical protein
MSFISVGWLLPESPCTETQHDPVFQHADRPLLIGKLRQPPNDPVRKAVFREQARDLVFVDRQKRKAKMVVDTAGMIASALEQAYKYGFEDAQREGCAWNRTVAPHEDAVEWITIPARARKVFEHFARIASTRGGASQAEAYYTVAVTERGTAGWLLTWPGETRAVSPLEEAKAVVAHQTIAILLRLGLVRHADASEKKIVISERGRNTWAKVYKGGRHQ